MQEYISISIKLSQKYFQTFTPSSVHVCALQSNRLVEPCMRHSPENSHSFQGLKKKKKISWFLRCPKELKRPLVKPKLQPKFCLFCHEYLIFTQTSAQFLKVLISCKQKPLRRKEPSTIKAPANMRFDQPVAEARHHEYQASWKSSLHRRPAFRSPFFFQCDFYSVSS